MEDLSYVLDPDYIFSHVRPRLIPKEEISECMYQESFLDLGVIYNVRVDAMSKDNIMASYNILNTLIETNYLDLDILRERALENLAKEIEVFTLEDMAKEIYGDVYDDHLLTVITNKDRMFGASAMLNNDIFERLRTDPEKPMYVLPSSKHEVLAVDNSFDIFDVSYLTQMVKEVNTNELLEGDILSYNVYKFDGEFTLA